jgi:3-deoxy-D-manno-octulosonic-acid transferase
MVSILYSFFHTIGFILFFPYWLWQVLFRKKYRTSTLQRLSLTLPRHTEPAESCILIHAISVGEVQAARDLILKIQAHMPKARIVVSTITETGKATLKRLIPEVEHLYFPFDFKWCCKRILNALVPTTIILVEGDFWFRFLSEAKKRGVPILLVNAKMSKKSHSRFCFVKPLAQQLFGTIDLVATQNEEMKKRFLSFLPAEKITVTGNFKGDLHYEKLSHNELQVLRTKAGIKKEDFVVTIASTHHPEEAFFLSALLPIFQKHPHLKMILVPRHPERFDAVFSIAKQYFPLETQLWTNLNLNTPPRVIVGNIMGFLLSWYQMADIAVVGGSFAKNIGGHNILEPIYLDIPTICGPSMYAQRAIFDEATIANAITIATIETLPQTIERWIENDEERLQARQLGKTLQRQLQGSLSRTLSAILPLIK